MRLTARAAVLSDAEIGAILRILAEVGICIENDRILQEEAYGGQVDRARQRVRYSSELVDRFLAGSEPYDWEHIEPSVTASAGVYHGMYHDPKTRELLPWTEERLAGYFALARALPNIGSASMLGSRLNPGSPLEPLWERYYCWKYGVQLPPPASGGENELLAILTRAYAPRYEARGYRPRALRLYELFGHAWPLPGRL